MERKNKGDKTIICLCGKPFTFSVGEQRFYKEKDYVPPKRCPECRAKRRQEKLNSMERPLRDDAPFPMDGENSYE